MPSDNHLAKSAGASEPAKLPTGAHLDWEGKRTELSRIALPFQTIETVNLSRAGRAGLGRFGQSQPDGWQNKLIWGDNKYVLASLLKEFAGKLDLIYIDPPFAVGSDFSVKVRVGDEQWVKGPSVIEEKAYRDTWGRGLSSYLQMIYERLVLMRDLLAPSGSIYVHLDYHVSHYVKPILDEIFGAEGFKNEIIWDKGFRGTESQRIYQHAHDTIFWYARGDDYIWNQQGQPYRDVSMGRYNQVDAEGRKYALIKRRKTDGSVYYGKTYPKAEGKRINDVIEHIPVMAATSGERVGFDTQKPEALLEVFVRTSSNEGSIVCDPFCGSGTTMVVAEKLGRRWIGCDLGRFAIHLSRKRLLEIPSCRPFEVIDIGRYERQFWQTGLSGELGESRPIYEYLKFIVTMYHGEPITGFTHLHGRKAGRVIHVGAVDAPVTLVELRDALAECTANKLKALDVLGWEFEMGLNDIYKQEGQSVGVDVTLKSIPREVMDPRAVGSRDVQFYELAHLDAEVVSVDTRKIRVVLKDFAISNPEFIPEDVRDKIRKWSDFIDYWAVDWNYRDDTFHNEWQTYRTEENSSLALKSEPHPYEKAGTFPVLVKVIDIFGNDTTRLLQAVVK
jgi:adenine-specific DNA-methyltransferase